MYRLLLLVVVSLFLFSCVSTDAGSFRGIYFGRAPRELRPGQGHFEVWLAFPAPQGAKEWVSILKFDDVEGTNHPMLNGQRSTLTLPNRNLADVIAAAVSIELNEDPDPSTPNRIFMSGIPVGGQISLDLSGAEALNMDLSDTSIISGRFVMYTPSDTIAGNDASGVWFVDAPFGQAQGPGLKLPQLPAGFHYEAWIATRSETVCISTGQFTSASGADANGAGPNGGSQAVPLFPGEDLSLDAFNGDVQGRSVDASVQQAYLDTFAFPIRINRKILLNPLTNDEEFWDVVVSIEPEPDNDPEEPFAIFPLVYFVRVNDPVNTVIRMSNYVGGISQYISIDLNNLR